MHFFPCFGGALQHMHFKLKTLSQIWQFHPVTHFAISSLLIAFPIPILVLTQLFKLDTSTTFPS